MNKIIKLPQSFFLLLFILVFQNCQQENSNDLTTQVKDGITTTTFKVWGNCEMCKENIESSLKLDGIQKSEWNVETKLLSVAFDSTKITLDQIQKNIANVGYDNQKYSANEEAYAELSKCCQYDRK